MFKVGDVVVYPIHGVARVTEIRPVKMGGAEQLCYILETEVNTGVRETEENEAGVRQVIRLPVDKVESNRVRKIVEEDEVAEVIEILENRAIKTDSQTWNRRHREYQDKMRTGSIFKAAEVYRDLCILKQTKDLSHGERRLFEQAKNLLVRELAIAKKTDEKEIERALEAIFRR